MTFFMQLSLLTVNDCYTRYLAERDQPAVMLTPNYFLIFCILIKNLQKMAYIMNTWYIV